MKELIESAPLPLDRFWGVVVGHLHFYHRQKTLFSSFEQWTATATKEEGSNAITLIRVLLLMPSFDAVSFIVFSFV